MDARISLRMHFFLSKISRQTKLFIVWLHVSMCIFMLIFVLRNSLSRRFDKSTFNILKNLMSIDNTLDALNTEGLNFNSSSSKFLTSPFFCTQHFCYILHTLSSTTYALSCIHNYNQNSLLSTLNAS